MIRQLRPDKRIIAAFPPKRSSKHLKQVAHSAFYINEKTIRVSQLPNPVIKADEGKLWKPPEWK